MFSHRPGWFEIALRREDQPWIDTRRVWIEDTPSAWSLHTVSDPAEAEFLLAEAWRQADSQAIAIKEMKRVARPVVAASGGADGGRARGH